MRQVRTLIPKRLYFWYYSKYASYKVKQVTHDSVRLCIADDFTQMRFERTNNHANLAPPHPLRHEREWIISFNSKLFDFSYFEIRGWKDLIIHEIAHIPTYGQGHTTAWHDLAIRLGVSPNSIEPYRSEWTTK